MSTDAPRPAGPRLRALMRGGAVFLPLAAYLWLVVDSRLLYFWPSEYFPAFRLGGRFAAELLAQVGGPVRYAAAFLSQFYFYAWAGALIQTAVAAALCCVAGAYLAALSGRRPSFVHYVPAIVVVVLAGRYAHHLAPLLAMLLTAGAACLWLRLGARRAWWVRLGAFLALAGLLHYAAAGAVLLFALLCAIGELARGRYVLGVLCAALGGALPYVAAVWVESLRPSLAYGRLLAIGLHPRPAGDAAIWLLYLYWPAAAGVGQLRLALGRWWRGRGKGEGEESGAIREPTLLAWALGTAALLAAVAGAAWLSFDRGGSLVRRIEFCARYASDAAEPSEQAEYWRRLLAVAGRLPIERYSLAVNWKVNQALCHLGQMPGSRIAMGDVMFRFPQDRLGLVPTNSAFPGGQRDRDYASLDFSDIFMDLGYVNGAERMTYQALELQGDHPCVLRRLAIIAFAKGQMEAGRVLLGVVSHDLIFGAWARRWLDDMRDDPTLAGHAEVARLRSVMLRKDTPDPSTAEELFLRLLDRNPKNRTAFEYLMAHYLLTGYVEKVAAQIGRLDDFGYDHIPRHYEEALLLAAATGARMPDLGGRAISAPTVALYRAFSRARARFGANRAAAAQAMAPEFGGSYLYYFAFRMAPLAP